MKNNRKSIYLISTIITVVLLFAVTAVTAFANGVLPNGKTYPDTLTRVVSEDGLNYHWVDSYGNVINYQSNIAALYSISNPKNTGELPSSYDARNDGIITSVKNQYTTGCCWAFSCISPLETSAIKQGFATNDVNYSEAHLVWFTHNSRTTDTSDPTYGDGEALGSSTYTTGGSWLDTASTLARGAGLAFDSAFPYSSNTALMGNYDESNRYISEMRLGSAQKLDFWVYEGEDYHAEYNSDKVKQAILDNGSVQVAYYSNTSYYNKTATYSAYYQNSVHNTGNHAVTIVGWDDNFSVNNFLSGTRPQNNGAWLCKNSWGLSSRMVDGYFWISYEDPSLMCFISYKAEETSAYENIYQYDGYGYTSLRGITGVVSGCNVFTTDSEETLKEVGFFNYSPDVTATVSVYRNIPDDYENPASGTLVSNLGSIFCENEGYYTIKLNNDIELDENERFAVTVTLTSATNSSIYFTLEGASADTVTYSSQAKQSYLRFNDNWVECEVGTDNNVCVKAMTSEREHIHSYEAVVTQPSCIAQGYTTYTCSTCGDSYADNYTTALGHDSGAWFTTLEATCTQQGSKELRCTRCQTVLDTQAIEKANHAYNSVVTPATCNAQGYTTYTCSVCQNNYTDEYTPVGEHSFTVLLSQSDGNCLTQGTATYKCVTCSLTSTVNTGLGAHSPSDWIITSSPSCASAGSQNKICTLCKTVLETVSIDKSTHTLSEWIVDYEPTCTQTGHRHKACSICGAIVEEAQIAVVSHSDANSDGYCDMCSASMTEAENCSCICHSTGFKSIIYKIMLFFWKIFGINKTCECGKAHYN